jgi:hypothetical protein
VGLSYWERYRCEPCGISGLPRFAHFLPHRCPYLEAAVLLTEKHRLRARPPQAVGYGRKNGGNQLGDTRSLRCDQNNGWPVQFVTVLSTHYRRGRRHHATSGLRLPLQARARSVAGDREGDDLASINAGLVTGRCSGRTSMADATNTAVASAGLDYQTFRNSRGRGPSTRAATPTHGPPLPNHAEVCSRRWDRQDEMLRLAAANGWRRNELPRRLRTMLEPETLRVCTIRVRVEVERVRRRRDAAEPSGSDAG